MRKDVIERHIDRKIAESFKQGKNAQEIRIDLYNSINHFRKNIEGIPGNIKENTSDEITNIQLKNFVYYIWYSQQKIYQLYKVEMYDIYGWNESKKFKVLNFKQKLLKVS